MPRRKRKVKNKNRLPKEIEEQPSNNNKTQNEDNKKTENEDKKIEEQKEEIKIQKKETEEESKEIKDILLNKEITTTTDNNYNKEIENNLKDNNIEVNKINLKTENIIEEKTIKENTTNNDKDIPLNDNEIKNSNIMTEKIISENKNEINEKEEEKEEISIKNDLKEKEVIKLNESQNNEEKKNIQKIANIEYERFIKENEKLYQYIKKKNIPIIIKSSLFKEEGIHIKNKSLLKIIKQSYLENDLKIYLTTQIITETVQFETSLSKNISYNPKIEKLIKNINYLNIYFPLKQKNNILIKKESFKKIFKKMGMDYYNDIYNFMQFTITEISYEYNRSKKVYVLKGVKSLKKLMEQNTIFYIDKNNKNIYDELIPLSNYSTQKIFNLFNGGKNTKYLLLNYEIKDEDFINYENKNRNYLNKLTNTSDIKNMLLKYDIKSKTDPEIVIKQEKLKRYEKLDTNDLDIYLNNAEETLLNIEEQINNKKNEILKLTEEPNNQFIEVIDSNGYIRFINSQYLKLMNVENDKLDKNIYSFDFYDYNNENITVMKKSLENLSKEEKYYVEIKIKDKNYLINKNKLLKICDSWKILYQEDTIDVYDTKNIKKELKENENEKINILLVDTNIVVQDVINEIKINENKEDIKNESYNENENDIINEKDEDNLIIIEEEENNIQEDDNKLRNKPIVDEKDKRKMKIKEYFNSLPPKNIYCIKYKVKTVRIPKKK